VRFASRLGFTIEKKTYQAIVKYHREIDKAAPPRLLEELYRLFGYGTGQAAIRLLAETKLLHVMLPAVDAYAARPGSLSLWACLDALDAMKPDPSVPAEAAILSALLYPLFDARVRKLEAHKREADHQELAREVLQESLGKLQAPRRIMDRMVRAFYAQGRFEETGRRFSRQRFVLQETFADALQLREMVLRARGGDLGALAPWRELKAQCAQEAAAGQRQQTAPAAAAGEQQKQPAARRRRRGGRGRARRASSKPPAALPQG
jgi:poly(A) polymerase